MPWDQVLLDGTQRYVRWQNKGKIQKELLLSFGMYNMVRGKEVKKIYFPNSCLLI